MPDGVRGSGRPGGSPGGRPQRGFPARERRFPRFYYYPIYYGPQYNRCDHTDSYGRCCDSYGRCDYDYYSGGYSQADGLGYEQGSYAPMGRDTAQRYGDTDDGRGYY